MVIFKSFFPIYGCRNKILSVKELYMWETVKVDETKTGGWEKLYMTEMVKHAKTKKFGIDCTN